MSDGGVEVVRERSRPRWRRWIRHGFISGGGIAAVATTGAIIDGWTAFGASGSAERLARMEASPQWDGDGFENPQPLWNDYTGTFQAFATDKSAYGSPDVAPPVVTGDRTRFEQAPATGLRVTWLGHSSLLIEVDGHTFLTDPVWGPRSSPWSWAGPERWYPPPVPLEELPDLDAIVISHDHYDHLDYPTIVAMKDWDTTFIAPLGVGAHLAYWGVPDDHIVEVDWWDRTAVNGVEVVCTPSRHASGRYLFDNNATLWAGYAFVGTEHRVFFSGDTGLFPAMKEIGDKLGPFDITMIEVGAYHRTFPDWHIGPEQAVVAHRWLQGEVMPIHWGLFDLAMHGWTEPIERVSIAADEAGITILTPKPGQSLEPENPIGMERWWPEVPWETAQQHAIVSTKIATIAP